MCFVVHGDCLKSKKASQDIEVYKIGIKNVVKEKEVFKSNVKDFLYKKDRVYNMFPFFLWKGDNTQPSAYGVINRGFHSYSDLNTVKFNASFGESVGTFIIPKGAHYYFNPERKEYVSNKIVFKSFVYSRPSYEMPVS